MQESTQLNKIHDQISSLSKHSCIQDFELLLKGSFSEKYSFSSGKILEQKISQTQALGIRLFQDDRFGQSYTESLDKESIETLFKQASQGMKFSSNSLQKLPTESTNINDANPKLNQESQASLSEKLNIARSLEEEVLELSSKVKSVPDNGLYLISSNSKILNSRGTSSSVHRKRIIAMSSCLLEDNTKQSFHDVTHTYLNLDEIKPKLLAKEVFEEASLMLNAKPLSSGRYDVIFDIESLESLFYTFSLIFSSESARKGLNPLWKQRGEIIASPLLNISDKPRLDYGLGSLLIDDEGVATQDTTLIEAGRFLDGIYNSYTANAFHCRSTGHARRSPKSSIDLGLHQPVIESGTSSKSELYKGKIAYITRLDGLHSGANTISGDFSFGVAGYVLENGVFQYAFKESTIKGNYYQMLKDICAIGDTAKESRSKDFFSPEIRFASMAFAS